MVIMSSEIVSTEAPAIELKNLTYVFPNDVIGLHDINLNLPLHSRTLLVGANGAGKSTLLRILAGKTLTRAGEVKVLGSDPFRSGIAGITYLGTEWAINPIVRHDMPVPYLLASVGGDAFPERRDQLLDILDVDLSWHMNAVSDGERRRVQLVMGLLRPWTILLLDEVTVDLDVLVRSRLLDFLYQETVERPCTVVYASHIFDGLAEWPTYLAHIHMSRVLEVGETHKILARHASEIAPSSKSSFNANSALLNLAIRWLKDDLADRGRREDIKRLRWQDVSSSDEMTKVEQHFKFSRLG
ncbi:P-loop containing nucleoside triphosphate hydrolase protein [Lipomyces oligophaga]|uniref:P-loop containing nucleoside triphosphate hydrolase protein n=1 Tax=Lipomyces oligophaga TaxID=45792 RepID=UPI0034CDBAE9